MAPRHAVKPTAHFEATSKPSSPSRLRRAHRRFRRVAGGVERYRVPNLQRFPDVGRPFLERPVRSVQVTTGAERLNGQLNALAPECELREYMLTDYLLLYAQIYGTMYMLSIRHQRQLSFDFAALGPGAT